MKPTPKQLAYLRTLAQRTGTTFVTPQTRAAASTEIRRLLARRPSPASDARREIRDVQRAMNVRLEDATTVRAHEVRGYGSSARWAHQLDGAA